MTQTPQEDLQSIPKEEMTQVEIDSAIDFIEKNGLTKEQTDRLLKAIINQDKDLPPNIKREIIGLETPQEIIDELFKKTGFEHTLKLVPQSQRELFLSELENHLKSLWQKETEKAFGGCKNCYGKGYATITMYAIGRNYQQKMPEMKFCSCERGKELEKRFEKMRQEVSEEIIKEILLDYEKNRLDGKGFDFYFALNTRLNNK